MTFHTTALLIKKLERRYACPALGLFYVRSDENIVPIAIQLQQVPGKDNPVWTPNDNELDWIYAKMWLRNADAQWHQVRISNSSRVLPTSRVVYQPINRRNLWAIA